MSGNVPEIRLRVSDSSVQGPAAIGVPMAMSMMGQAMALPVAPIPLAPVLPPVLSAVPSRFFRIVGKTKKGRTQKEAQNASFRDHGNSMVGIFS